jgi:hypothetical protein
MTKQDIIRMVKEAGDADRIDPFTEDGDWVILTPDEIVRFANLVASAEREACAKVCENYGREAEMQAIGNDYAQEIRARGQA